MPPATIHGSDGSFAFPRPAQRRNPASAPETFNLGETSRAIEVARQLRRLGRPFTREMVRRRVESELTLFRDWESDCLVIGTTLSTFISARPASIPLIDVRPYAMSRGHLAATPRPWILTRSPSGLPNRSRRVKFPPQCLLWRGPPVLWSTWVSDPPRTVGSHWTFSTTGQ